MTPAYASSGAPLLKGKHALVTGGARGIGLAIAKGLLAQGVRLTIAGRDKDKLEEAVRQFHRGGEAGYSILDVTNSESVASAFKTAEKKFGPIGILVNNAGQAGSAPFLKTNADLWRRMMSVNLDGTFLCSQAVLPGMLESGWGRIVNVASTAGLTGYRYVSAYCASKHGVIGLTRALALEVATKGVTVNAVCPGYTETDMVKDALEKIVAKTGRSADEVRAELVSKNPQKRFVKPEEAANAVAWLCLPGSEAINGQAIAVAGGEVM
jgi:NAD(P)-dependent dehydrogenase (short-subunit alcohol dehydrogenase family)